ncbi:MAG: alpha-galactosidase, partial [Clostridia bacterium]|nr:alpha-galactosidase [Clostridia bacterium]
MTRDYRNAQADLWYRRIIENPAEFPFAFSYDGARFEGFPAGAFEPVSRETREEDGAQVTELCWRHDEALFVMLRCAHYPLYGATDWIVWFENRGTRDTGILSDAESVLRCAGSYPTLKGILGDHTNWYRPYALDVAASPRYFESNSGRATHVNFPYFNLECGDGGVMLAIGWAGTWRADFRYDRAAGETEARLRSVNRLHTRLRPGETIRTARFAMLPYAVRNEHYAANCWRSWFINCNMPRADASGAALAPFSTCCLSGDTGLPNSDGSISERCFTWRPSLEKMIAEDVKVDFRWFDAGWYVAPDLSSPESDWWGTVGTWTLDPAKWPGDSFRESTDFTRAHGMRTLMWFEPERVTDPDSLAKNFGYNPEWAIRREGVKAISNNIGNPDCFRWTVDRIKKTLSDNHVDMYREDNNSDQAGLWNYL